ncbi:unnamed protein product [Lepeophtheirus salmonis]|uniref:(salmon louse) hypothetical protein n=1 Tax=Lepeophtheirus salmonis TaxID=72036 RepID=A0A7R8D5M2_LEPSM|nr:unnamed protein product [Lepeophtheirus salmonis]CAF2980988.1 unnamed protein product [Lepeophtheirus salmonis]
MSMEDIKAPSKIAVLEQEVVHVENKVSELRRGMGEYTQVEEPSYNELTESTYHQDYSKVEDDLKTYQGLGKEMSKDRQVNGVVAFATPHVNVFLMSCHLLVKLGIIHKDFQYSYHEEARARLTKFELAQENMTSKLRNAKQS